VWHGHPEPERRSLAVSDNRLYGAHPYNLPRGLVQHHEADKARAALAVLRLVVQGNDSDGKGWGHGGFRWLAMVAGADPGFRADRAAYRLVILPGFRPRLGLAHLQISLCTSPSSKQPIPAGCEPRTPIQYRLDGLNRVAPCPVWSRRLPSRVASMMAPAIPGRAAYLPSIFCTISVAATPKAKATMGQTISMMG